MIPLSSNRWAELRHAYGPARDIPALIAQLETLPEDCDYETEPYHSLWSSICHQGTAYSASYAAIPHIIRIMAGAPLRVPATLFQLVARIEIGRHQEESQALPDELSRDYFSALSQIPGIVAEAAKRPWDENVCRSALSAVAVIKGHALLAEAIEELDPESLEEFARTW